MDDIKLPGMLYVGIVRSPYAHARINSVDTGRAAGAAGVAAVITGKDVRERQKLPLPITWVIPPDIKAPEHWAMATDVVRYVGEPVAAVAVEDRYAIEDALDLVSGGLRSSCRWSPSIEDALKDGAPLVHEELGTNQAYYFKAEAGDVDAAFRSAEVVVKQRHGQPAPRAGVYRDAGHRGAVQQGDERADDMVEHADAAPDQAPRGRDAGHTRSTTCA